ncbi:hypothetical protein H0H93_004344 [Arthromyces matolae]|nr:hypothetical protein H0H93_004344 [Arthromyces matolae]
MGRRKIEIQPITRKNGLFKKAHELGVLCSVDVAVIIFGSYLRDLVFLEPVSLSFAKHTGERDTRGPTDFGEGGTGRNEAGDGEGEDEDEDGDAEEPLPPPKRTNSGSKKIIDDDDFKPSARVISDYRQAATSRSTCIRLTLLRSVDPMGTIRHNILPMAYLTPLRHLPILMDLAMGPPSTPNLSLPLVPTFRLGTVRMGRLERTVQLATCQLSSRGERKVSIPAGGISVPRGTTSAASFGIDWPSHRPPSASQAVAPPTPPIPPPAKSTPAPEQNGSAEGAQPPEGWLELLSATAPTANASSSEATIPTRSSSAAPSTS